MSESGGYVSGVGRKPTSGGPPGEAIERVAVKVWLSRWRRLGELVGESKRSELIRQLIEKEIAKREHRGRD